jgi:pimeloyl-ACP methyl ester carboxylesterase
MVYRTHSLEKKNPLIKRALIVIHGQGRNADHYFRTGAAAAFLAGALDDTIVISPRFASSDGSSCKDELAKGEINWRCSGDSWRSGATSVTDANVTSYDFTDALLRKLARKSVFPNLKIIVVSGHSAGGQYVSRYAMASTAQDKLGVPVTYVVSNPSSYAYLDESRPPAPAGAAACDGFDKWPYGLHERKGYAARLSDEQLKKQYVARPVVYLLGELDTLPLAGFDSSCPAMAQGPSRLERGKSYAEYVNGKFGAHHTVTVVPMCGHNARCVFTADPALGILFPKL